MASRGSMVWGLLGWLVACQAPAERARVEVNPSASVVALTAASASAQATEEQADPEAVALCRTLAEGIEALKPKFPSLQGFSALQAMHVDRWSGCRINHTYRCHAPPPGAGWRAAVPRPDEDGVWFAIALWEPPKEQPGQLQSQTFDPSPMWLGKRRVSLQMLQGKKSRDLWPALRDLLRAQGATEQSADAPR